LSSSGSSIPHPRHSCAQIYVVPQWHLIEHKVTATDRFSFCVCFLKFIKTQKNKVQPWLHQGIMYLNSFDGAIICDGEPASPISPRCRPASGLHLTACTCPSPHGLHLMAYTSRPPPQSPLPSSALTWVRRGRVRIYLQGDPLE